MKTQHLAPHVGHRYRHGAWLAGGLATALVLLLSVTSGDAGAAPVVRGSDAEALRLLRDAGGSVRATHYEGTQFITTWSDTGGDKRATTSLVRVTHTPGQGTYIEVRRTTADASRGTYEPDSTGARGGLTGFTPKMLDLMVRNYAVVQAGEDSVCGRPARVVEARRPDGSPAGRFWIDRDTGLMLHRELLDGQGRAVSITGFYDIRIGRPKPQIHEVQTVATPWGRELAAADLGLLRRDGWTVPNSLPGRLELYDARQADQGGIVHLVYSDGLSAVSLFIQRGELDERRFARWRKIDTGGRTVYEHNALRRWAVWDSDEYVYTVLADAPQGTADAVIAALPHGGPGFWGRLGRGLKRLGSWLNPFE
ncbi:MAG TPA: sigma-E factor regulatory protein RseB domain-containing protein [Streptosporangiaceae bacterium]|nr:sigma-E factor regulatory protein RseB domain-containing protein [Streptosporangiaceae bacterium]